MILQTLDAYYRRKQMDPDPSKRLPSFGLEDKEIPFVLDIDEDGRLINITDTRNGEGKKKVGQRFLVPQGVKKTSGVAANLLWDTAEYALGIDTRDKPERVAEQHAAFRARIEALPDAAREDAGIGAVLAFLDAFNPELFAGSPAFADIQATNPVMSFRLHSDLGLVCQRPAVVAATANQAEEVPDGMCLVSGAPAAIERLHPAIKGVWGAQTSGANIVSFNLDAFSSYGKAQGANAPLGKAAVFAYTTALNHLLARDSRQRIQVGDASTVFWAEETHDLENTMADLFGDPPKDNPDKNADAIKALYASVASGQFSIGGPDTRFHVLGLAPNAARISIRFWETATAAELAGRIKQHFDDLGVVHAPHDPEHLSLFRLLTGVALLNKADNIPPNLGGEVMRSILEGLPYPASLLNLAVVRCRAEQKPTYARAAVIKACLNRHIRFRKTAEKEFTPMLDPSNNNPAYRLGRLFATLERIQEDAAGGPGKLNATIRDRYYGAASSTPAAVFPTLLRLSKAHLGKLSAGFAITRERLIGEIMDGFDADTFPPRHLALPDQARFALGYYQQRQAFFAKTEPKTPEEIQ
ncbi:type I-C CRISPR-associated protein Cas8c/Csd1 [Acidithiobacillus ferriphilus]|uniref:type I-C CRISPR-associated protein Cas8c/Csd1 n=1 Tax=Acidithiobacillus ferriphilus TaxID=1689834 RepID=UPI001C05EEC8|nr:type I-C CRISPR-associated protein Cas8c/Csd1 [Acidithiobacillus ferriphilus]MBU2786575.1 type I-C CRISPR-associated protein Cas8c/Csd1 [Acidithiobacillus ferriphilus]